MLRTLAGHLKSAGDSTDLGERRLLACRQKFGAVVQNVPTNSYGFNAFLLKLSVNLKLAAYIENYRKLRIIHFKNVTLNYQI